MASMIVKELQTDLKVIEEVLKIDKEELPDATCLDGGR